MPVSGDWFIKLNSHGKSFVRVKYSEDLLKKILLNISKLSTPDKTSLLSDTISMLKSGKIGFNYFMQVIDSMKSEDNHDSLVIIIGTLREMKKYMNEAIQREIDQYL